MSPTMMLINYMTGLQLYSLYRCMWVYRCIAVIWTYGGHRHGGIQMYGMYRDFGNRYMGVYRCMEAYRLGSYRHPQTYSQPDITPTCLPTTPEGICKKFSFPFIISHVHHLSTEMGGQKPTKMPE